MDKKKFQNVLGRVVTNKARQSESARANARAFSQFEAIASVSTQNVLGPVAVDQKKAGDRVLRGYAGDVAPNGDSAAASSSEAMFTVSELEKQIDGGLSLEDLKMLRRQFAFDRHPDRVPASQRTVATYEMTRVNALIDNAIRKLVD